MAGVIRSPEGIARAECTACEWTHERSLTQKDLSPEKNRDIVVDVARNHSHRCPESGDNWSETVRVETSVSGGE